jgi:hypothetical protein
MSSILHADEGIGLRTIVESAVLIFVGTRHRRLKDGIAAGKVKAHMALQSNGISFEGTSRNHDGAAALGRGCQNRRVDRLLILQSRAVRTRTISFDVVHGAFRRRQHNHSAPSRHCDRP